MAGPNLELFRFSLYLFFPLAIMVHFGDPQWYHDNVLPFRDQFWPAKDKQFEMPRKLEDVRARVEEIRAQRSAVRAQRQVEQGSGDGTAPASMQAQPSLRAGGHLGVFSSVRRTGVRQPDTASWREAWDDARRGRVV